MDTLEQNEQNSLEQITWSSQTHVGMRRSENQDSLGQIETEHYKLFIVADGMGGVQGGAVASKLAITSITDQLSKLEKPTDENLVAAVNAANQAVFNKGLEDRALSGMGTTLVGLLFFSNRLFCVNVGDSRAYLIRDGLAMQLTQDHTVVSELLRSGAITENQVNNFPISHMLTRSIGPTAEVAVDCFLVPNAPLAGDRYLLCSDGLYNHVDSSEIANIVDSNEPNLACARLIELANERGGSDNITVTIIDVDRSYSSPTLEFDDTQTGGHEGSDADLLNGTVRNGTALTDSGEFYEKLVPDPEVTKRQLEAAARNKPDTIADNARLAPSKLSPLGLGIVAVVVLMLWWAIDRGARPKLASQNVSTTQDNKDTTDSQPVAKNPLQPKPAAEESVEKNSAQEALEKGVAVAPDELQAPANDQLVSDQQSEDSTGLLSQPFGSERLEKARMRMKYLQTRIDNLEQKLAAFDKPLSGAVAQDLSTYTRKLEEIKGQISAIDGQLAESARSLAVLYGQQQRMRSVELLKLAAEVAETAPAVEKQKKVFEAVSWRYLQEREKIERDPRNLELRQRVDELALERRQELDKLGQAVRQSIIADTLKLDRQSAELSQRKDALENELQSVQDELNFIYALMSQDPNRRSDLKVSLEEDLRRQRAEYNTLQNMIISLLGEG